jgi:hypothetical protein
MPLVRSEAERLQFRTHTLQPGEALVAKWVASRSLGSLGLTGGNLVLTSQRLLFEPIRTPKPSWFGKLFGAAGTGVAEVIENSGLLKELGYSLADIASVEPLGDRPPKLRVLLRSGEAYDYQVLPSRLTPVFSRNTKARDDAMTRIRGALAGDATEAAAPH